MATQTRIITWLSPTEAVVVENGVLVDWLTVSPTDTMPVNGFTTDAGVWSAVAVNGTEQPHRVLVSLFGTTEGVSSFLLEAAVGGKQRPKPLHVRHRADGLQPGGARHSRAYRSSRVYGFKTGPAALR